MARTADSAASLPRLYCRATSAPSFASSRTAARPMLPLPPVTRATRPSRRHTPARAARGVINPSDPRKARRENREIYPPARPHSRAMGLRIRLSTEFAFLLSGVFIMLVAWALNLIGSLSGETSSGHGVSDVYLWLILMFQGLAFSTMGVIGSNYRELMSNPVFRNRYLVAFLLIADGGLHLLALNQHLDNVAAAAFFAIVSPVQIVGGIVFQSLPRGLDRAWLLFTVFLIAAFVVTRTVAIWPIGFVEDADPLGLLSKAVEVLTTAVLVPRGRARGLPNPDRPPPVPVHGP